MKTTELFLEKISLLLITIMLTSASVFGATFTAVSSGNWSSSTTWGVSVPPFNVASDQIIIPVGVNVIMDGNVNVSGVLASVNVEGTLTSASNTSLTVSNLGTISGTGTINTSSVTLNTGAAMIFTGSLVANTVTSSALAIQVASDIVVNETLNLAAGVLTINTGGSLSLASNATVAISAGSLSVNGGTLGFSGMYNVTYSSGATTTGVELTGSGLNNVTVNVSSGNTLTLTSDLFVGGTLALASGTFALNGNDLTITGNISASGSGTISASIGDSDININAIGGISGSLNFTAGANIIDNLSVNVGLGNQVQIGGNVIVNGSIQLTSGTLNFSGATLTINGLVNGSGSLSGNASSNITINTNGGITGGISFASGGQMVNNFTINVGSGNSVTLSSNLTVTGTLALTGGSILNISGQSLIIGGNLSGLGSFTANTGSGLIINADGGISSPVSITGAAIGTLVVNVGTGNTVTLGSNLTVSHTLNLQTGTLVLNNNNLTVGGNISAGGSGIISSTGSSNITINSNISPSGSVSFDAGGNTVNNFTVNIAGNGGSITIGSDLTVNGNLNFINGSVNIGDYSLDIAASGSITGAGNTSYVITGTNGALAMQLTAGAGSSAMFPVGTSAHYAPANIQLNTGSTSGEIAVGVAGDVHAGGTTGADISVNQPIVDATWHIASDITTNLNMNMEVMWSTAMEVNAFNRTSAYISHYTGGNWDMTGTASATVQGGGMFSLQRTNITSLSPFAVFDQNTTTAISEVSKSNSKFIVYPNPASNYITVQNSTGFINDGLNVDVTNVIGEIVASYRLTGATLDIPVSTLYSGNYFIRLYNDKTNAVKKFTKM